MITGGTGLIGKAVTKKLIEYDSKITIISLDNLQHYSQVEYIYGDLTDFNFCLKSFKNFDFVFHLAGIKGSIEVTKSKPASFFVPLLMMNTNVLEAARQNNISKLVYTSSIGAYSAAEVFKETKNLNDPPQDTYPGWAKRMAELQIGSYREQFGTDWSIVRPCNVYGPGDNFDPNNAMVIPSLISRIANGENPLKVWGDGTAVRDFAYAEDIALGVILALQKGTRGDFVNLGSGKGYSIRELVDCLKEFIDFNYEFDASKSPGFPKRVMDIQRAREWLGYEPQTSLREGLENTWKWFNENKNDYRNRKNYFE